MVAAAVIGAGVASAAAGVASGAMGSSAASDAANKQAAAANAANSTQAAMWKYTQDLLLPWVQNGQNYQNLLNDRIRALTTPWNPTENDLANTPGYQFTRDQGLKAVQNSAAARGLGISGAALKGASAYATGLADNTWKDVFNADQAQKQNIFNKLYNVSSLGETAAAGAGSLTGNASNSIANTTTSAGNAQAAGAVGSANALSGGLNGAASSLSNAVMMNQLFKSMDMYGNSGSNWSSVAYTPEG